MNNNIDKIEVGKNIVKKQDGVHMKSGMIGNIDSNNYIKIEVTTLHGIDPSVQDTNGTTTSDIANDKPEDHQREHGHNNKMEEIEPRSTSTSFIYKLLCTSRFSHHHRPRCVPSFYLKTLELNTTYFQTSYHTPSPTSSALDFP